MKLKYLHRRFGIRLIALYSPPHESEQPRFSANYKPKSLQRKLYT
jgi:hypothetical protein